MKKIIKGKTYNTKTSTNLGFYSNDLGWNNPMNIHETLFKTRNGSFFMLGCGGSMTRYAKNNDFTWVEGRQVIIPVSEDNAKEWLKLYGSTEEYEQAFGV